MKIKKIWNVILALINIIGIPVLAFHLFYYSVAHLYFNNQDAFYKLNAVLLDKGSYYTLCLLTFVMFAAIRAVWIVSKLIVSFFSNWRRKKLRAARLQLIREKKQTLEMT